MSKAKTVQSVIRLVIKAGQAKPAPPVGPALGQAGLNLMSFCKDFNARTADIKVTRRTAQGVQEAAAHGCIEKQCSHGERAAD